MNTFLRTLFSAILIGMIAITVYASFDRSVFVALTELWPDLWFRATLADAYFGFLTFYVWVAYKERAIVSRLVWFVAIMAFGNIAMAIYVLLQLFKVPAGSPLSTILLRDPV